MPRVKPKCIFGVNRTTVVVEVLSQEQSGKIATLKNVEDVPWQVTHYDRFNNITCFIYFNDFDITDLNKFVEGLQQEYNVASVMRADFINAKNSEAHAFHVTFRQDYLQNSIYMPGESQDTKVYPYNDKPMMCYKCQEFGHTLKRCKSNAIICWKCAGMGHYGYECISSHLKCFYCGELPQLEISYVAER